LIKDITVIKGDGIGPEIVNEAIKVLDKIADKYNHKFYYAQVDAGGCALDKYGTPLPAETLSQCLNGDSVLLGAVGGPKWDNVDKNLRAEKALLQIRSELGLFANLRPAKLFSQLKDASPLNIEIVKNGIDLVMVRELTGGIYFGEHKTEQIGSQTVASDLMVYSESEIERIALVAFDIAMKRNKRLLSVDKANVLDSSRLWRKVMHTVSVRYPEVEYNDMLVDNAAMQIVKNPAQFDVIVTENMFGDILSDEASMITGSIGMIPSASFGTGTNGMYEPIHGSAPDIAGKNIANPIGTILSAAMMLLYSFGLKEESLAIETAVNKALDAQYRTADIMSASCKKVSCSEMGDYIAANI